MNHTNPNQILETVLQCPISDTARVSALNAVCRVYISGPITSDPLGGMAEAVKTFHKLRALGFHPHVPHLSNILHMQENLGWEDWLELDEEVLPLMHANFRVLPNEQSSGSDREKDRFDAMCIPTFTSVNELCKYATAGGWCLKKMPQRDTVVKEQRNPNRGEGPFSSTYCPVQ